MGVFSLNMPFFHHGGSTCVVDFGKLRKGELFF